MCEGELGTRCRFATSPVKRCDKGALSRQRHRDGRAPSLRSGCQKNYCFTSTDFVSLKLSADSAGMTMFLLPVKAAPAVPAPAPARPPMSAPLPPPASPPMSAPAPAPPPIITVDRLPLPFIERSTEVVAM